MPVARWVLVFPGATIAAWAAYVLWEILQRTVGVRGAGGWYALWIDLTGHAVFGATFVYTAARIAPAGRRQVAAWAFGASVFFAGALGTGVLTALYVRSLGGGVALIIGAGAMCAFLREPSRSPAGATSRPVPPFPPAG